MILPIFAASLRTSNTMPTSPRIPQSITDSIAVKQAILNNPELHARIRQAADIIIASLRSGGKVHFCGNGGSAADAQHLAAELSGRYGFDRPPLNAEALHCNTSYLTAVANDYGYEKVFARLISGLGRKGDILVGISTSGNSKNILQAFDVCKEQGLYTIAMTGASGGKMRDAADLLVNVPSNDTPRIQEAHITVGHIICELVEQEIFGEKQ